VSSSSLIHYGLNALHMMQAHVLLRPFCQGLGMIVTLHRVQPAQDHDFQPNALLSITPEFLDQALLHFKRSGLDLITMDEVLERMMTSNDGGLQRRFVCVTFDDGYRDNITHAMPVLEAHQCPALVYIPTDFVEGEGCLWWAILEEIIDANSLITLIRDPKRGEEVFATKTAEQKYGVYRKLYRWLRSLDETRQKQIIADLCKEHHFDAKKLCRDMIITKAGLKKLSQNPLITIGAHTQSHPNLAKLDKIEALDEMVKGRDLLEQWLGVRPRHFAYPYGSPCAAGWRDFDLARQAGFSSAVTTRKGMIFKKHHGYRYALPRVSLNGYYQEERYLDLFNSGVPFSLARGFRHLNVR
jgi:peptidoglycan/xylan/chitin deacetylase (PgdA/CDA1 family)